MTYSWIAPTKALRSVFFLFLDGVLVALSLVLSFSIRFEFAIPGDYKTTILVALPLFVFIKTAWFAVFRLYRMTWRYVGLNDLFQIVTSLCMAELLIIALIYMPLPTPFQHLAADLRSFPRSVFLLDLVLSIVFISALRISKRVYLELFRDANARRDGVRTLIIGAGDTGEMVIRDIVKQRSGAYSPVGILDRNPHKHGMYLHGVKILGSADDLGAMISMHAVSALIVAIPSLGYKELRSFYDQARSCGIRNIKIVPRIYDVHKPEINMKSLEDIRIEDLLGRQVVNIDYAGIERFIEKKCVIISGAGGSIGSEIVSQVCGFNPARVVLFDIDETELHELGIRLSRLFPDIQERLFFITGDVRDEDRLREVFAFYRPQIVFHAAAYKHVPMMESNAGEAVKVNILGTDNLARVAVDYQVDKFVLISTDKAVRPTSIMGATKRMAEYIISAYTNERTEFVAVRFGNVLGSRGSVLPLFLQQLKEGGPLTVTHEDMKRYFMTIPEAVSLVLQASTIGRGGEVLVLDMGEPVKILALAEDLIRIHGMEPYKDIDIQIRGLRPGEKLFEELLTAEEGTDATLHEKIFVAKTVDHYTSDDIQRIIKELKDILLKKKTNREDIRTYLKNYISYYEV